MEEFVMNPSLEIRDVDEARTRLLAYLDGSVKFRVDVTPIVAVDSAGVQLLIALRREAHSRNVQLEFTGYSAALRQILTNLGLGPLESAA